MYLKFLAEEYPEACHVIQKGVEIQFAFKHAIRSVINSLASQIRRYSKVFKRALLRKYQGNVKVVQCIAQAFISTHTGTMLAIPAVSKAIVLQVIDKNIFDTNIL